MHYTYQLNFNEVTLTSLMVRDIYGKGLKDIRYSRQGTGNLVLKHSGLHFLLNFQKNSVLSVESQVRALSYRNEDMKIICALECKSNSQPPRQTNQS